MKKKNALAKLSLPRLSSPLLRERLFSLLDELRERPVVAVVGPPGAGKTTLVASYVRTRDLSGIWYQVDQGDADAATFFYYLRLAVQQAAPGRGPPLQLFTPEYLSDLTGFARRFFRQLYARLKRPTVVVLDNFQDAPGDSPFVTIVREALLEIPHDVNVILCSRSDPPPEFARFVVNERMGILDWRELRLSLEETRRIAMARAPLDEAMLRELYARSDGWAAGVTLMLEHVKRTGQLDLTPGSETKHTVFRYFAGEIFDRASGELQQLLLRTACCERVTVPLAEQVTGNAGAGKLLEELYRHHYFTYRRNEAELSYFYHALFREFLLERARELWSQEEIDSHARRTAGLLETLGEAENAIGLYMDGADYDSASRLILREATALLASGRWQTLGTWMRAFPQEYLEGTPWLQYWWGTSLIPVNQAQARCLLERAYQGMLAQNDRVGRLLAAAGAIETHYFEWATFTPMDQWISAISEDLEAGPQFPSAGAELRVFSALVIAMSYRQPQNPLLPRLAQHTAALLGAEVDVNQKVTAGTCLLGYGYVAADHTLAHGVLELIQPLVDSERLSPLNQIWWRARVGYYCFQLGEYDRALCAIDEANEIANRHGLAGLHTAGPVLNWFAALVALSRDDLVAAEERGEAIVASVKPGRTMDLWYLTLWRASLALRKGDLALSHELARSNLELAVQTGMIYIEGLSLILLAHVLVRLARYDEALELVARGRGLMEGTVLRHLTSELSLIEAYIALRQGDGQRCRTLAASGFHMAKESGYLFWFRWVPEVLPVLCGEALATGLQPDWIRDIIRRFGVLAPGPRVKHWPWPLRLSTLGRNLLEQDGKPVELSKRARKPLELLKAVVACGGRAVDVMSVADMLWPDADGDAAQKAFETTLHRLRRQLGNDRSLTLRQGAISINPQLLWVDVLAFDELSEQIETLDRESRLGHAPLLQSLTDALFDLYAGRFLSQDPGLAWAIPVRDRLHGRFLRALAALGSAWETTQGLDRAVSVYQRGLRIDQAAEPLYQRLMACYQKTGRLAEAIEAYRNCQEALSSLFGRRPSAETETLGRSLSTNDRG
ncbi:MAG: BTAD domain-containing putative transcriptional regulator [Pseudomonadota bacterium]